MQETRKVELHYPLERLNEPIVTRLVTEYDLAPNLLRADVDAHKGGWLIVELTGEAQTIDNALNWLRGQGIVVTGAAA